MSNKSAQIAINRLKAIKENHAKKLFSATVGDVSVELLGNGDVSSISGIPTELADQIIQAINEANKTQKETLTAISKSALGSFNSGTVPKGIENLLD